MIYHEPIPVFEAHCFLTCLTSGFESLAIMERRLSNNADIRAEFSQYYSILFNIIDMLKKAVTAQKSEIDALYMPIKNKSGDDADILFTHTIANCFIMEGHYTYDCYDDEATYENIRKRAEILPSIISEIFLKKNGESDACAKLDTNALIEAIIKSDYSEQTKLALIDAAVNPARYAEGLIALLKPVVKAFRDCEELYRPMLQLYDKVFSEISSEQELMQYFYHSSFSDVEAFDIYPKIIMPLERTVIINNPHDGHGCSFIGVFSYWAVKRLGARDLESELVIFMDALSNKNRIRIIKELAAGKKFGRELAEKLHLTNSSISQSLNQLVKAGLVAIEDVGTKGYCSVDKACARRLVNLIIELFALDEDQADD